MKTYNFKNLFIDVDGVMTKVFFAYSRFGKSFKFFSADDSGAIKLLSQYIDINFVTADFRGFPITRKRIVKDMGQKLSLIPANDRLEWISSFGDLNNSIYIGDSFEDIEIMKHIGYGISVSDSSQLLKNYSNFTTTSKGGERAVSEACFHILYKFFNFKI